MQPGSPIRLDLYWRGEREAANEELAILLEGDEKTSSQTLVLWEGPLAPSSHLYWKPDEAFCRRLRMRLPMDISPGQYRLLVRVSDVTLPLRELTLGPSTRRFDVPPVSREVDAMLGEWVRLVGFDVTSGVEPGRPLTVTLVWQTIATTPHSYTAFVHLLDETGRIVAQSDAIPAGGYATHRWVPGEVVVDPHPLTPSPEAGDLLSGPERTYRLVAGLYDPVTGRRVPAWDARQEPIPDGAVPLGEITLP